MTFDDLILNSDLGHLKNHKMNFFRLHRVLPIIACLLAISCDQTEAEPEAESTHDIETARIKGELRLINLSQDAKSHTLSFGESNAFMKTEDVPAPATQVHEKSFYLVPTAHHPRLILVGKIRVEVCREPEDHNHKESASKMSNDMSRNPASYPQ